MIEEVYNFSFEQIALDRFKESVMRDLGAKGIESLVTNLSIYIQVRSDYEMHQRIYENKIDPDFENKMRGIKKLQDDLSKMLKNIGQK